MRSAEDYTQDLLERVQADRAELIERIQDPHCWFHDWGDGFYNGVIYGRKLALDSIMQLIGSYLEVDVDDGMIGEENLPVIHADRKYWSYQHNQP
mgnify:CR=1 FL=1